MSSLRRAQHVLVAQPRATELESILAAVGADGQLQVSQGRTGKEVIEVLQNSGRPATRTMPSLLLLDMELDDPGAAELIAKLRECPRTNCMPIVVLGSDNNRDRLADAYAAGANSCLIKPATREEYEQVIQRTARYWLRLNQLPHQLGAAISG